MPIEVRLAKLGQTMEEGTVVNCHVKEGDQVSRGQVMFDIETDKATIEMESPADGYVKRILVEAGRTIPVGDPMMILGAKDETITQEYIECLLKGAITDAVEQKVPATECINAPAGAALPQGAVIVDLQQLGQTMEEGTIVNCHVKVGDEVSRGQVLFDVETDKATIEMESPAAGTVKAILVGTGTTVPVGTALMVLGEKNLAISQEIIEGLKGGKVSPQAAGQTTGQAAQPAVSVSKTAVSSAIQVPDSVQVVSLQQLGQTMEEGTVVNCHVNIGDYVERGKVLFDIETDKATIEMESPTSGYVKAILVDQGQTVPVGTALVIMAAQEVSLPQNYIEAIKGGGQSAALKHESAPVVTSPPPPPPVTTGPANLPGRIFASPRAKMTAKDRGVDLSKVTAGGPGNTIVEADVLKAAAGAKAPAGVKAEAPKAAMPAPKYKLGEKVPASRLQKIIAQRMVQSKREIPCFYLNLRADVTELVKLREHINRTGSVKVSFNDLIIKAMAIALKQFPIMTGQLAGDYIELAPSIGIGLAISVEDGLVAPILKKLENKSLANIASDAKELIERAKAGKLAPADLEGGCITLSNLGAFGIESFIPIVVPGQCSILGVGKISDTCVPVDGNIMVRKLMSLTLAVDHKVANGAYAAQFLDYIRKVLEDTSNFE